MYRRFEGALCPEAHRMREGVSPRADAIRSESSVTSGSIGGMLVVHSLIDGLDGIVHETPTPEGGPTQPVLRLRGRKGRGAKVVQPGEVDGVAASPAQTLGGGQATNQIWRLGTGSREKQRTHAAPPSSSRPATGQRSRRSVLPDRLT